ncbi:MAG TPA: hypothetical protein VGF60_20680 [Xanthobacteraceae bacterium]|jgi:hypothetical protein
MRRQSQYLVACCGLSLAMAAFLVGFEVSSTTAATSAENQVPSVNRTLKGDRIAPIPGNSRNAVNGPAEIKNPPAIAPRLLDGCEPVVSAIGQSPLARIAGRCLS